MGDEDGSTFIIKNGNELTIYRIDGWMYPKKNEETNISLDDVLSHFPKWRDDWKHGHKDNNVKYTHLYMGFGNSEKENYKYAAIYNVWENAFIEMVNNNGYIIK